MTQMYSLLLPAMLVVLLFVGSVSATVWPAIPSPPYVPKSPQEDIVKVEAWIEQPGNLLYLIVTFAAPTPPTGQDIYIILTKLDGSTETRINYWIFGDGGADTTYGILGATILPSVDTPLALYAYLGPPPGTDRAPNSGFYHVTATSEAAPNIFYDPEPPPVGGVVVPVNKLAVLSPYLALIGLVGALTVTFAIRRRKP